MFDRRSCNSLSSRSTRNCESMNWVNLRSRSLLISKTIWLFSMLCKKRCQHRKHPHFPLFFCYMSSLSSTLKMQSNSSHAFHMPWTHPSRSSMSIWHNHGSHAFMHLRSVCISLSFQPQTCLLTKLSQSSIRHWNLNGLSSIGRLTKQGPHEAGSVTQYKYYFSACRPPLTHYAK